MYHWLTVVLVVKVMIAYIMKPNIVAAATDIQEINTQSLD